MASSLESEGWSIVAMRARFWVSSSRRWKLHNRVIRPYQRVIKHKVAFWRLSRRCRSALPLGLNAPESFAVGPIQIVCELHRGGKGFRMAEGLMPRQRSEDPIAFRPLTMIAVRRLHDQNVS